MNMDITTKMPAETASAARTADSFSSYYKQTETNALGGSTTESAYPKTYDDSKAGAQDADRLSIYGDHDLSGENAGDNQAMAGVVKFLLNAVGCGTPSPKG